MKPGNPSPVRVCFRLYGSVQIFYPKIGEAINFQTGRLDHPLQKVGRPASAFLQAHRAVPEKIATLNSSCHLCLIDTRGYQLIERESVLRRERKHYRIFHTAP